MIYGIVGFVAAVSAVGASTAVVKQEKVNMINSDTLPGNLLPNFLFQQGSIEGGSVGVKIGGGRGVAKPFNPDDTCGVDIFDGAMTDMRSPQLPYLTQDLWTCDRKREDIDMWVLEDKDLKVTIAPQWSGKIWQIYDNNRKKDWLFGKSHQPANIGALKSWAAGGAEWNWSPGIIGHSAFSETEVYLARLDTERGPVLRVYEFDRYNGTVWQVDTLISNGSVVVHPRITNPTDADLRGYWWTCVAVDSRPTTRIFAPATHVAETTRDQMRDAPWPFFNMAIENSTFNGMGQSMTDNSWIGNHQIGDMFLRIPDTVYTPYIAHTQQNEDGFVLTHGHPLNGTKFYTWGQSGPGRFMQDFLAGEGKRQGDYTELQVGPAPTQMQNFPVPKHSVKEWTEWFKGFNGDDAILQGVDYSAAIAHIDSWIQSPAGMQKDTVNDLDDFFVKIATQTPDEVLVQGQAWGYLEEKLLGHPIAPGLTFQLPEEGSDEWHEMLAWKEIVETKKFDTTLNNLPLSYQTTDRWLAVLQASAKIQGMTWLHALHLGIMLAERGNIDEPKRLFELSNKLKPNPIAQRNLAVLQSTAEAAWPYWQSAWKNLHEHWTKDRAYDRLTLNFITEISNFLQQEQWYEETAVFIDDVTSHKYMPTYQVDAYITLEIKYYLNAGLFQKAIDLLSANCFPTYAKMRSDLMSFWNVAQEGLAAQKKGSPLSILEKHQARVANRIPDNIGCQYASDYCTNYW